MAKSLKFFSVFLGSFSVDEKRNFVRIARDVEKDYVGEKKVDCDLIVDAAGNFIARENKRRVGIVKKTDVLSFFIDESEGRVLGQIVILKEVENFENLLRHSILHVLGYDHETDEEWEEMQNAEKLIFSSCQDQK